MRVPSYVAVVFSLSLSYTFRGLTISTASVKMMISERNGMNISRMSLGTMCPSLWQIMVSMVVTSNGMKTPLSQLPSRTGTLNVDMA